MRQVRSRVTPQVVPAAAAASFPAIPHAKLAATGVDVPWTGAALEWEDATTDIDAETYTYSHGGVFYVHPTRRDWIRSTVDCYVMVSVYVMFQSGSVNPGHYIILNLDITGAGYREDKRPTPDDANQIAFQVNMSGLMFANYSNISAGLLHNQDIPGGVLYSTEQAWLEVEMLAPYPFPAS